MSSYKLLIHDQISALRARQAICSQQEIDKAAEIAFLIVEQAELEDKIQNLEKELVRIKEPVL